MSWVLGLGRGEKRSTYCFCTGPTDEALAHLLTVCCSVFTGLLPALSKYS